MKKMFIVAFIVSASLVACGGKKKTPDTTPKKGSDMGSAMGSDMGSGSAATPEGGSAAM